MEFTNMSSPHTLRVLTSTGGLPMWMMLLHLYRSYEPVSKPKVRTSCTFDGRVVLTCSVDKGDRVVMIWTEQPFAWTGSNQTLSSGPVLFLDSHTPGNLTCVAMNEISEEGFSPAVLTCRGHRSAVAAFGLFAFALTTLAVAILHLKKRRQKKKKGQSQTEYVEENNYIGPQEETTIHPDQDTSHYEFCRPLAPASSQRKRRLSLELNDIYV
ncbi:uncharacterized protein LOC112231125 isoform X2 [Oncorhynchus tshawytscha]|uniref:uncharacterized protein LOC112231125 isoform X2 n=1 Tax=Oncorhynchus tshawytscha TaxID=74940 RepID=UPI001C3E6760|nr:uncharacterized protein LOC112231125 isoform X2 [Oncorhynchus tshawytscha]